MRQSFWVGYGFCCYHPVADFCKSFNHGDYRTSCFSASWGHNGSVYHQIIEVFSEFMGWLMMVLEARFWLGLLIGCCSSIQIASLKYICSRGSSDGYLDQCTNQPNIGLSKIRLMASQLLWRVLILEQWGDV